MTVSAIGFMISIWTIILSFSAITLSYLLKYSNEK